jgi:3-oxoacyl-[acyl-carrier-protein] synthase-3
MNQTKKVKIVSSACYLPKKVSSKQLEDQYNLPKGWSEKYSGVANRHHVTFESNGYMGARAIEAALENSNLQLSDIDLIISAGATFDYPLPNQASVTKSELKDALNHPIPTIDIDTTCLSFVTSFEIASKMIDNNQYKNIIIVSSEIASKGLNPNNRETLTLFGDAAAAVIVSYQEHGDSSFIKGAMNTHSQGVFSTLIKGGGNKYFFKDYPYDENLHSFAMDGPKLLKLASKEIKSFLLNFFKDIPYSLEDVDIVIPHQTSKIGQMLLKKTLNTNEGKIMSNLSYNGNCISASIPLLFHQSVQNGKINRGDLCLFIGTSAGFSIGASLFRF